MQTYLVAYDISDPKRLRQVALACQDYGHRHQRSVFICTLPAKKWVDLSNRLAEIIKPDEDRVVLIPLCGQCVKRIRTLGCSADIPNQSDTVLII